MELVLTVYIGTDSKPIMTMSMQCSIMHLGGTRTIRSIHTHIPQPPEVYSNSEVATKRKGLEKSAKTWERLMAHLFDH